MPITALHAVQEQSLREGKKGCNDTLSLMACDFIPSHCIALSIMKAYHWLLPEVCVKPSIVVVVFVVLLFV